MNFGIVVEGECDKAAYPELIRKVREDAKVVLAVPCGNDIRLMEKFVGWLYHFEYLSEHPIDKALVVRDSDCSDPAAWEQKMHRILARSRFVPRFPVHFHAAKCEIESWLLADANAINQVAKSRGKRGLVPPVAVQLESYRDAKELFRGVLAKVGLPADPKVYQEIAAAADIRLIAQRCRHFHNFENAVNSC